MNLWRNAVRTHPHLTAWAALAVGMVVVLLASLREAGLQPSQVGVLIVSTVLLAGLCVWIIRWEDE